MSTLEEFKRYGYRLSNEDEILKSFLSKKRKTIKSHGGRITLYIRGDLFVDYIRYAAIDYPEDPPLEIVEDMKDCIKFCAEIQDVHQNAIKIIMESPTPNQTQILSRS